MLSRPFRPGSLPDKQAKAHAVYASAVTCHLFASFVLRKDTNEQNTTESAHVACTWVAPLETMHNLEWESCRSLVKLGSLVAILSIPESQFFLKLCL